MLMTIMNRVQVMQMLAGRRVMESGKWIEAGTRVQVGQPIVCWHGKEEVEARAFLKKGVTYYILEQDLHPLEK